MRFLRLAATNWMNCAVLFVAAYVLFVSVCLVQSGRHADLLLECFLDSLLALLYYGSIVLLPFSAAVFVLDIAGLYLLGELLRIEQSKAVRYVFFAECLLISIPFLYWAVEYDYYPWYALVAVFWLSQWFVRRRAAEQVIRFSGNQQP